MWVCFYFHKHWSFFKKIYFKESLGCFFFMEILQLTNVLSMNFKLNSKMFLSSSFTVTARVVQQFCRMFLLKSIWFYIWSHEYSSWWTSTCSKSAEKTNSWTRFQCLYCWHWTGIFPLVSSILPSKKCISLWVLFYFTI